MQTHMHAWRVQRTWVQRCGLDRKLVLHLSHKQWDQSTQCQSRTSVHCDHTVHISADLSLWLDNLMFWAPRHQSMSTYSQPSLSSSTWNRGGVWMCKLGIICQEWLKIEVKFLSSANRKSYMPCRLAQQWMTLSDLEWPSVWWYYWKN